MKKTFQIILVLFSSIFFTSCSKNDTAPPAYWKVIETETGKVTAKMEPEVKGPFMYKDFKGDACPVIVVNGQVYQTVTEVIIGDSVLILHSVWSSDSTEKKIEVRRI